MFNQQQQPEPHSGFRNFIGLVAFAAQTFAVSVEVFLRKPSTFGERYLGLQAGAALPLMFFWPAFCEPYQDPAPMFLFTALYVVACMIVRVKTASRRLRGGPQPRPQQRAQVGQAARRRRQGKSFFNCPGD